MKKVLLSFFATVIIMLSCLTSFSQTGLAPDQNPNYEASLAKYMNMADSLNRWHSSTQHDMYKAIDWLADRKEARADRREFRRQLRLERARYYNSGFYYNDYRGYHNRYRYHPFRGHYYSPFNRFDYWWR